MRKVKSTPEMKSLLARTLGVLFALTIAIPLSASVAAGDSYPSKPVRLIIPFAPGGSTDIIGRLVAAKLSERLGKQVVAENHGGGGGTIGMELVAKSQPDGYTLLFTSSAIAINPLLYKVPYDPVKSFIAIAKLGNGPVVLTVHPGVPANSVKELIALAKKQPGKLVCAAAGMGSFMHLGSELFKMMAGIDILIVQFKGGGPAMIDTMGGHSQISLGTLTQSLPQIKAGKLKVLGFGGSKRSKLLPEVPTISEAGVPGYEAAIWWGLFAPAGTPKAIVDRVYKELAVILNSEDTKKIYETQGAEAELLGPAEFVQIHPGGNGQMGEGRQRGQNPGRGGEVRKFGSPGTVHRVRGRTEGLLGAHRGRAGTPRPAAAVQQESAVRWDQEFSMKLELRNNKDFWAGMMLIGIGAAAMFISRDYRFGSALRMGPGFFPTILGGILIAFGVCIMAVGLRSGEKIQGSLSLRALVLLPLSLVLFGVLMEHGGLHPGAGGPGLRGGGLGQGVQVRGGPAADRAPDRRLGGFVHLGTRAPLPPDQGILIRRSSWTCFIT